MKEGMESKELATREGGELALTEEALIAAAKADLEASPDDLVVPRLKITDSLTREVDEGLASAGELIHSLTGESYGTSVEMVVVDSFKGREWRDPDRKFHSVGRGEAIVPWENHPCYGQPFVECPDAEEQHRAAVRANEKDWGSGPGIATSYNFVGLLIGEDGELEHFPVRLSLSRARAKEGRNFATMLNIARAPWDNVYEVSAFRTKSKNGDPFTGVRIKQVRKTTPEERQLAVEVAQRIHTGNVVHDEPDVEADDYAPTAPTSNEGGLDV